MEGRTGLADRARSDPRYRRLKDYQLNKAHSAFYNLTSQVPFSRVCDALTSAICESQRPRLKAESYMPGGGGTLRYVRPMLNFENSLMSSLTLLYPLLPPGGGGGGACPSSGGGGGGAPPAAPFCAGI